MSEGEREGESCGEQSAGNFTLQLYLQLQVLEMTMSSCVSYSVEGPITPTHQN